MVAVGVLLAWLSYARYATFHNETFDLAFYARMAWGMSGGSFWEPIVGAHVLGVHLSPVVIPFGWLGRLLGTTEVLLVAQAAAVSATAWPLARMGYRHLGDLGALMGAGAWLLYPNVGHVATFEFHPGTMAVLPLAWAIDGLDRKDVRAFGWAVLGVLCCREDLALVTALLGVLALRSDARLRRVGLIVAIGSALYFAIFALVLHPIFAPARGSLELHFGKWGDTPAGAVWGMLSQPADLARHLAAPERLTYLPKLLAPLALLPLLRPRWLLVASPVLAMNLVSEWPDATALGSHYQTPALPMLLAGAIEGAALVARRAAKWQVVAGVLLSVVACHLVAGGTPVAADFDRDAFRPDARSLHAARAVAAIPPGRSVQAPYALMPHLAERMTIGAQPPPDRDMDYVILDAWPRIRYAHDEDLLRTIEEPELRSWLSRADWGLVAEEGPFLVLRKGAQAREGIASRYIAGAAEPGRGQRIAACLSVLGAQLQGRGVELTFVARSACPNDMAIRIGTGPRPRRVDLLFDGLLGPAHLRRGDLLRSEHALAPEERREIERTGLSVGALRSSGARPEHEDPVVVDVPLG